VPWVVVNGVQLDLNDPDADFKQAICDAYKGDKPAACDSKLGEVVKCMNE